MMATNDLKSAGVLRRGPIRLKLYVIGSARATPDVDADLIRRLTKGLAIDPAPDHPLAGFLLLSPQANAVWRCGTYLWSTDGLTRSVLTVDLASGLRCRAPDAAFRIGCEGEVWLIAEELRAWQTARHAANPIEAYLERQAA
jgi:hypothetical protein